MANQQSDRGQGDVKNPETDGRLKQNRHDNNSGSGSRASRKDDDNSGGRSSGGQGEVKNPDTDGRLKENRN